MPGATHIPVSPSVPIETLNRFTASIIHKVSNPLSIIIGNAQYLLMKIAEEHTEMDTAGFMAQLKANTKPGAP